MLSQQRDSAIEHGVKGGEFLRIARAVATYFGERRGGFGAGAERITIRQRQKVLHRPLDDLKTMLGESKIAYHRGLEQADGIARR